MTTTPSKTIRLHQPTPLHGPYRPRWAQEAQAEDAPEKENKGKKISLEKVKKIREDQPEKMSNPLKKMKELEETFTEY